jgi:hypothetical protein
VLYGGVTLMIDADTGQYRNVSNNTFDVLTLLVTFVGGETLAVDDDQNFIVSAGTVTEPTTVSRQ